MAANGKTSSDHERPPDGVLPPGQERAQGQDPIPDGGPPGLQRFIIHQNNGDEQTEKQN